MQIALMPLTIPQSHLPAFVTALPLPSISSSPLTHPTRPTVLALACAPRPPLSQTPTRSPSTSSRKQPLLPHHSSCKPSAAPAYSESSSAPWLYRPPPPYCPIPLHLDDHVAALERRIDYLGPVNRNKLVRALEMAKAHHLTSLLAQNVTIAAIVADMQMDVETVCAAVLRGLQLDSHDVEANLGKDVAVILNLHRDLVRVLDSTRDSIFTESNYASLRELILVSAVDDRAISLELASAVVATRALDALPTEDDKVVCARRAMHLYAPLANQLGIWFIQTELEELAFMYLHPGTFHSIRRQLAHRMRESQRVLIERKNLLDKILSTNAAVRASVRSVQIKGRIKGTYSCYRKMQRTGKSLADIYDLLALRIIVSAKGPDEKSQAAACYAVASAVRENFETVDSRSKDYVANPKPNGYRSLHLTVAQSDSSPSPLEIQIRTEMMHHVAEFGAAAHWVYKESSTTSISQGGFEVHLKEYTKAQDRRRASLSSSLRPRTFLQNSSSFQVESEYGFNPWADCSNQSVSQFIPCNACVNLSDCNNSNRCSMGGGTLVSDEEARVCLSIDSKRDMELQSALVGGRRVGEYELRNKRRGGYMRALVEAINGSRVIVMAYGHLYRLTLGSTLQDLARAMGLASMGVIALVNGRPVPMTHRLQMSDIVKWL